MGPLPKHANWRVEPLWATDPPGMSQRHTVFDLFAALGTFGSKYSSQEERCDQSKNLIIIILRNVVYRHNLGHSLVQQNG